MATIDELVVKLALDATGFQKGQKDATTALQKTKDEAVKHGGAIEGAITKAANSFESMAAKALTVFAIFAGAKSVEDFTRKITALDVAVGRLSTSMGQSPDTVSAIGKAVERMGGSADTAMSGLRGLSDAFEELRTTGSNAIMQPLAQLQSLSGKAITFGKDVHKNFLSIADALQAEAAKDPALASMLGRKILGSDDLTNLAMKGRAGVLAAEAESRRHGVVNPDDVAAATKLTEAYNALSQSITGTLQKAVTALTPYISGLLTQMSDWVDKNREWIASEISKKVQEFGAWLSDHKSDIEGFVGEIGKMVTTAGEVAKAFSQQSPMMQALEAFGVVLATRLSGVNLLINGMKVLAGGGVATVAAAVAVGASAESTPGAGIPADAAERAKVAAENKRLTDEANAKSGQGKGFFTDVWNYMKTKVGLGGTDKSDSRVKDAIIDTAEGVKKLVDQAQKTAVDVSGFSGVTASSGGLGGSGKHADGGSSPGASLRDRQFHGKGNFGEKGWWTPERQGHAIDVLMKQGGLTEDGAKALVSRWKFVESAGGPSAVNPHSGAEGIAQWLGGRKGDGSGGSFDEQLGKVARELNGKEARAKALLNTPGKEANGASAYERAEGWNARTNTDNFTGRVREGMKHIVHGSAAPAPSAPGAGTPAPSGKAITDGEVFAARQRILNGSRDPKDKAMVDAYMKQQNTPGKQSFLSGPGWNGTGDHYGMGMSRMASAGAMSSHVAHNDNSSSSETHIAKIEVHTAATDAHGIAADIGPHLQRGQRAATANYGLA